MANKKLGIVAIAGAGPLHPGDNSVAYPALVTSFSVAGPVNIVDPVLGGSFTVSNVASFGDNEVRGTDAAYDLRQINVDGACTLILDLEADRGNE